VTVPQPEKVTGNTRTQALKAEVACSQ